MLCPVSVTTRVSLATADPLPVQESPVGALVDRVVASLVVVAAAGMVAALRLIAPSPVGHGTHEFLGMRPCGWPEQYGVPCPTCGVTTAATHLVHLHPLEAFLTQPFGALLAVFGLWHAARALVALGRGHSFVEPMVWWNWPRLGLIAMALLLVSWAYKWWIWA